MNAGALEQLSTKHLYREYLRRLDAQAVLDHYGAENATETRGSDGTIEVVHSCLLDREEPHHSHGDQKPSASCNLEKKVYNCFGYWGGTLLHLMMKMEHKGDLRGIVPMLTNFLGESTLTQDQFRDELYKLFDIGGLYTIDLPSYSDRILLPWAKSHPYLREVRGISVEASTKLRIGYDPVDNRITFPVFWEGKLVGWQKRAIPRSPGKWPGTDPDWPKYRSSSGFPKKETFYNFPDQRERVLVVESPFSVAKAVSLGLSVPTIASFGASFSDRQLDLLKDFREVTVWMDDGNAGEMAERRLVRKLHTHSKVYAVQPDIGKDLADYDTLEEVEAKIEDRIPAIFRIADYNKEINHGRR